VKTLYQNYYQECWWWNKEILWKIIRIWNTITIPPLCDT